MCIEYGKINGKFKKSIKFLVNFLTKYHQRSILVNKGTHSSL